jgi:hypothetical protein
MQWPLHRIRGRRIVNARKSREGPFACVTEAIVNGLDDLFDEREGRIVRVPDRLFEGEEPVLHMMG